MISLAPALLNLPSLPLSLIRIDAQYSRFLLLLLLFFISFLNGSNTGFVDITTSPYVLSFQLLYSCTYIRSLFHLIYCAYLEWVFWADLTAHYLIISSLMFFSIILENNLILTMFATHDMMTNIQYELMGSYIRSGWALQSITMPLWP